ncbi:MAG: hypothetical protein M3328_10130, partial [Chloroflexota bacterium]|nr:hypothetical protein [Chloroflexota bacterium]
HSTMEHRFVLADFEHLDAAGDRHVYEAGRSYSMPPAIAHAAARRDLVSDHKPPHWTRLGITTPAVIRAADFRIYEDAR